MFKKKERSPEPRSILKKQGVPEEARLTVKDRITGRKSPSVSPDPRTLPSRDSRHVTIISKIEAKPTARPATAPIEPTPTETEPPERHAVVAFFQRTIYKMVHRQVKLRHAFLFLSLSCLLFLLAVVIYDYVCVAVLEDTLSTSHKFTVPLLFLHTFSYYLALLSYVYTVWSRDRTPRGVRLTLLSFYGNMLACILRAAYEYFYYEYRPEE